MSTTMSGITNNPIAKAPRQSGLKKPRPLRSVSLQEVPGQNVKRERPERQVSSEYPSQSNTLKLEHEFTASTLKHHSSSNMAPCGDGFQKGSGRPESARSPVSNNEPFPTPGFQRQNSAMSQDSSNSSSWGHSRRSSMETASPPAFPSSATKASGSCFLDANANKVIGSPASEAELNGTETNSESMSVCSLHKEHFSGPRVNGLKDKRGKRSRVQTRENLTLATLMTTKGKQLVLSGTCIQTILTACKLMLQEMGASIIRLETVENPKAKDVNAEAPPSPTEFPDSPTESDSQLKSRLYYSKEELLALSDCNLSRKAPAMWNILAPTHADCCIPANQLLEYFEPIDFHPHDGTLVTEEFKRRDRRE